MTDQPFPSPDHDPAAPPLPPAPPPPPNPYAAGQPTGYPAQQQPGYGMPPAPGSPATPAYAAQPNPYGGYTAAPPPGYGQAYPGTLAYVQQYFGPVASFGSRALALIIDVLINLLGLVPLFIGVIVVAVSAPDSSVDGFGNSTSVPGTGSPGGIALGVILIVLGAVLIIAIALWNRVFRMGRTGQSVGKQVVGLRLVNDQTGQPIGAGMAFVRELVHGIVNQVIYLSYLWMLWDDNKQTLADKAVKSTVIVVPKV